jgi:hypothetical protein
MVVDALLRAGRKLDINDCLSRLFGNDFAADRLFE